MLDRLDSGWTETPVNKPSWPGGKLDAVLRWTDIMTNDTVAFIPFVADHPVCSGFFSPETGCCQQLGLRRNRKPFWEPLNLAKPMIEIRLFRRIVVLYVLSDGMFCVMIENIMSNRWQT